MQALQHIRDMKIERLSWTRNRNKLRSINDDEVISERLLLTPGHANTNVYAIHEGNRDLHRSRAHSFPLSRRVSRGWQVSCSLDARSKTRLLLWRSCSFSLDAGAALFGSPHSARARAVICPLLTFERPCGDFQSKAERHTSMPTPESRYGRGTYSSDAGPTGRPAGPCLLQCLCNGLRCHVSRQRPAGWYEGLSAAFL